MTQTTKLTASDGASGDEFGSSVSVNGNTTVVGAPDASVGGNSQQGAAYVFDTTSPSPGAPTFSLTGPTSGTFTAGQSVSIQWNAGNVATGSTINLCYDGDTTINGNEHWIEVNAVAGADGSGSYSWDTTGVPAGTYYLAGYLWSGGTATFSHLTQSITIQAGASKPTFSLTGPTSGTFTAGQSVTVQWTAGNVGAGSTINLCYDTDTTINGNEHWIEVDQVAGANGNGSYSWDTTGVPAGTYYLAGYLWSGGTATLLPPHPIDHHSGASRHANLQPDRPHVGDVYRRTRLFRSNGPPATWGPAAPSASATTPTPPCNGNETWIEVRQGGRRQRQRQLQLGHHRRAGRHVLHWRLSLVGRHGDLLPPHPVDHHSGAAATPTFSSDRPHLGDVYRRPGVPIQWTAGNVAAGSTISLCYDTDTAMQRQRDLDRGRSGGRRQRQRQLQLGHHRRDGRARTTSAAISTRAARRPTPTSPSRSPSRRRPPRRPSA